MKFTQIAPPPCFIVTVLIVSFFCPCCLQAQDPYYWNATTGDYGTPGNWLVNGTAPATAPDNTSTVYIQSGTSALDANSAAATLTIGGGTEAATANVSTTTGFTSDISTLNVSANGTLNVSSDSLNNYILDANLNVNGGIITSTTTRLRLHGTTNIMTDGTVTLPGLSIGFADGTGTVNFTINGGSITAGYLPVGHNQAGIFTVNANSTVIIGPGAENKWEIGNGNKGEVFINGGTIEVKSATTGTTYGSMTIGVGANLGQVTQTDGAVHVNTIAFGSNSENFYKISGGTVTANTSITVPSASQFQMTGGTVTTGKLDITGNPDFDLSSGNLAITSTTAPTFNITNSSATASSLSLAGGTSKTLSGNLALTKTGTGTLTLPNANSYSGDTTISGGTVSLGNDSAFSAGPVTLTSAAKLTATANRTIANNINLGANALTIDSTTAFTLGGVISGTGSLSKTTTGALTLTGQNTFSGGLTATGCTINISQDSIFDTDNTTVLSSPLGTGKLNLSNVILAITKTSLTDTKLAINGAAAFSNNTIIDVSNYLKDVDISAKGTITVFSASSITGTPLFKNAPLGFIYSVEDAKNIVLNYSADTNWTWTGTQSADFTNQNNWDKGSAPTSGSDVIIKSGATNTANVNADVVVNAVALDAASNLTFSPGKTLAAQSMTIGGTDPQLELNGGNLTLFTAPAFDINNGNTSNASTLTLSSGDYANSLSGTAKLTKIGAGDLTLSAVQAYTGATTVAAGKLILTANDAIINSQSVSIADVAVIDFGATTQTLNSLSGAGTLTGTTGTVSLNNPGSFTGTITGSSALTLNYSTDATWGGTISGASGITKTGNGKLTFNKAQTFSGTLNINEGAITASNPTYLGGSNAIAIGENGTLEVTGTTAWTKTFTGTGKIDATPTSFIQFNFSDSNISDFSGTVDIDKTRFRAPADARTANDYMTYNVGNAANPSNDVQLWINGKTVNAIINLASLGYTSGSYAGGGQGGIRLEGNATVGGVINVLSGSCIGTYDEGNAAARAVSANINLSEGNMLYIGNYQNGSTSGNFRSVTLSGEISGEGNLQLRPGTGNTVTISHANNTYTGTTTVGDATYGPGALALTAENAIAASSAVINNTGITFTAAQKLNNLTGAGTLSGNAALTLNNTANSTYSGVISGATAVTTTGTAGSVLTLSGANTFTGGMTISTGTVSVATGSASLGAGDFVLNSGATLQITGGDTVETLTIAGAATLNGIFDLSSYLTTWDTAQTYTLFTAGSIANTTGLTLSGVDTGWGWTTSDGNNSIILKYSAVPLDWTWTGETGPFNTASNWAINQAPTTSSDVTIAKATGVAQITENAEVNSVTLGSASNLSFTAGKTLTAQSMTMTDATNALNLTGGNLTLTNAPAFNIDNSDTTNASTVTLSTGNFANVISGNTNLTKTGADDLTISAAQAYTGATTVSAGTLVLGVADAIKTSASVTNNAAITFGTFDQTLNNLTGSGAITGADGVNLELCCNTAAVEGVKFTGTINAANATITKTGAGRMKLYNADSSAADKSLTAGTLAVNSGRLDIQGWLNGSLTVQSGAVFSPGNSIGTTHVTGDYVTEGNGTLLFELGGSGSFAFDQLTVDGAANLNSDSIIQLAFSGVSPTESSTYDLFTATGITYGQTYDWEGILRSAGMSLENWSLTGTATAITLAYTKGVAVPVPEPSAWALLILGALGLTYFRRKR